MLPCPVIRRPQARQSLPCPPVSVSRLLTSNLERPTSALCRRHRDAKPASASLVECAFTKRDASKSFGMRSCKNCRVAPPLFSPLATRHSPLPLTPFLATHPRNRLLSPIIATLPKTRSRKSFACHTSVTPTRGVPTLVLVPLLPASAVRRSPLLLGALSVPPSAVSVFRSFSFSPLTCPPWRVTLHFSSADRGMPSCCQYRFLLSVTYDLQLRTYNCLRAARQFGGCFLPALRAN